MTTPSTCATGATVVATVVSAIVVGPALVGATVVTTLIAGSGAVVTIVGAGNDVGFGLVGATETNRFMVVVGN